MYEIEGVNVRESDREKFVRLANKRVPNAIKAIQLVANLSNRSNYDYTDEDASKIVRALQDELNSCRRRFELAAKSKGNSQFVLD